MVSFRRRCMPLKKRKFDLIWQRHFYTRVNIIFSLFQFSIYLRSVFSLVDKLWCQNFTELAKLRSYSATNAEQHFLFCVLSLMVPIYLFYFFCSFMLPFRIVVFVSSTQTINGSDEKSYRNWYGVETGDTKNLIFTSTEHYKFWWMHRWTKAGKLKLLRMKTA